MDKFVIFAMLLIAIVGGPASASCYKPDAPSCATTYGRFDDQDDFDRCKNEMESYQSDLESFLDCQKRESRQAIEEYNEAVERFNRRARGD